MKQLKEKILRIKEKKKYLDLLRPLPKEVVDNLNEWMDVELTYNSNAIEGNTLSKQETAMVIEKGITVAGKSLKEHLEAINHKIALEFIKQLLKKKKSEITLQDILEIHRLVLKSIDDNNAGKIRKVAVKIAGTDIKLPDPIKLQDLMEDLIAYIQISDEDILDVAIKSHYKLVAIHPFVDGNGRTARLLMNLILMQEGYPPANLKKEDRDKYLKSLMEADKGNLAPLFNLLLDSLEESLDVYIEIAEKSDT